MTLFWLDGSYWGCFNFSSFYSWLYCAVAINSFCITHSLIRACYLSQFIIYINSLGVNDSCYLCIVIRSKNWQADSIIFCKNLAFWKSKSSWPIYDKPFLNKLSKLFFLQREKKIISYHKKTLNFFFRKENRKHWEWMRRRLITANQLPSDKKILWHGIMDTQNTCKETKKQQGEEER